MNRRCAPDCGRRRNATGAPAAASIELKTLATLVANGSSKGSFFANRPSCRTLFGKSGLSLPELGRPELL